VLVCSLVAIFLVAWLITGFAFIPIYLTEARHYDPHIAANVMGALGFCAFLGGALMPLASDRFGRKPVLIVGSFIGMAAPLAAVWFHGPVWMLGLLMFVGWITNGIFPLFMGTIPGESLPRAHIATAMGIVVGIGEILGGVAGPFVAGQLADKTSLGLQAPMFLMAGFCAVAGVIALFLKETAPAKVGTAAVAPAVA
jgi:ACS family hexuronate transporter-like MFS transporter